MKKLRVTFLNEDGTKKNITFQHVAQDLAPVAVYAAMVRLTELEIFEKNGVKLMTKVLRACYVDDVVVELFSVTKNAAGEETLEVNVEYNRNEQVQSVSWTAGVMRFAKSVKQTVKRLFRCVLPKLDINLSKDYTKVEETVLLI